MKSDDEYKFNIGDKVTVTGKGPNNGYKKDILPTGFKSIVTGREFMWNIVTASNVIVYQVKGVPFKILEENLSPTTSKLSIFLKDGEFNK